MRSWDVATTRVTLHTTKPRCIIYFEKNLIQILLYVGLIIKRCINHNTDHSSNCHIIVLSLRMNRQGNKLAYMWSLLAY